MHGLRDLCTLNGYFCVIRLRSSPKRDGISKYYKILNSLKCYVKPKNNKMYSGSYNIFEGLPPN